MRIKIVHPASREQGSILGYLVIALVLLSTIASVTAYVAQTFQVASRRENMVQALQYAEGGSAIGCTDVQLAFKSTSGTLSNNLVTAGYSLNTGLTTAQTNVFQRTITAPFTNQTVTAQIWMANVSSPPDVKVIGLATVKNITQKATTHLQIKFGYGAAIISDNPGTSETGISKSVAMDGNVVVNGDKTGPIVVDGGGGLAILANGNVNLDPTYAHIPASSVSANDYSTANEVPDYTNPGSANQLFDFNRFIAVADATPGPSTAGNNHFTNVATFATAVKNAKGAFLEGVIVVNIKKADMSGLDPTDFGGYPLNVHGTVVFNFASDVAPTDKMINTTTMNINPADLSHLVASDPSTYASGYPPVYINPAKNPVNIDISSKGFANFTAGDDLPAMMYNIGIFDIHGNVNISGVLYSPSFFEIENKQDGQTQYFKGCLVTGGGIYYENLKHSTSIISYDSGVLDNLSTQGTKGKGVFAAYWE
jgi:hypothetical protein